ncbi:MAG: MFS transporter [Leptolyngbya sp. PLA1]|nr:MFS transporter [Leptolyngbya sp. PLA1]
MTGRPTREDGMLYPSASRPLVSPDLEPRMSNANSAQGPSELPQLMGHPAGLFTLFFAEMWERFSYYGMRALLVFYMIKGFLGYGDKEAYEVYGAYTALVYATPFIGGMVADRLLGARRSVVLGGMLMAAGHLLMTIENKYAFFGALALLICGNGFFKPNISTIVGSLYPAGSPKRDAGFTIFYIGINLGAALAPLLCGYVGETYGWHYGFGLATIGMLIGLAVFVAPRGLTQALIVLGAIAAAASMVYVNRGDTLMLAVNAPVGLALLVAAFVAAFAVGKGGLPDWAGRRPQKPTNRTGEFMVYAGVLIAVPVIALLVSRNTIAGYVLTAFGILALGTILVEALRSQKVERERLFVVLAMMFFSMLFWAFFEQAGSSVNNFTDRNVQRVTAASTFTQDQVGTTIEIPANQALVGLKRPDGKIVTLTEIEAVVTKARDAAIEKAKAANGGKAPATPPEFSATIPWTVSSEHVGQSYGGNEVKASVFQAVNPVCIMIFGLVFSALWGFLGRRKLEPSTPIKFSLGLLQLGLGFIVFWYGASQASDRGMTSMLWLVVGYALHTTGELCLSPVGLSMVTRLSPARMVSTVMGGWFLATAFSNYLAGLIAGLTGVSHGGGDEGTLPPPQETVGVYGDVFLKIGIAGCGAAVLLLILSPILSKWMHSDLEGKEGNQPAPGGH